MSGSKTIYLPCTYDAWDEAKKKSSQKKRHVPKYKVSKVYKNKQINIQSLVTDRYDLANINEAVDKLKSGKSGRIIINF